ncbi:MAG: phosphoenolpyruvate--protein phosphotransferase [Sulfolobales archaeon]|nr:phosphoenolpyruvate--protein phosphotransferase [Sulfolobales archaeon]
MRVYRGLIASEGVAVGPLTKYGFIDALSSVPSNCPTSNSYFEVSRLEKALSKFKEYLVSLKKTLPESEHELINAHEVMAEALVNEAASHVVEEGVCGELAVKRVFEKYSDLFKESGSGLIALRAGDLRNIASAIVENLTELKPGIGGGIEVGGKVVVAKELNPVDLLKLVKQGLRGIVTLTGGVTSHAAIIARAHGIPYIIVPELDLSEVSEGELAVIDSIEEKLLLNPSEEIVSIYVERASKYESLKKWCREASLKEAVTTDGVRVGVLCNVGDLEEARAASTSGCDGIGLFRVEYLYISSSSPPSEESLYTAFNKVLSFFNGKPVVIRAPDLGADKPLPYIKLEESNPFLGLRGVRLLLEYRDEILNPFLRALLRASTSGNARLLIPMISRVSELIEFTEIVERTLEKLRAEGIASGSIEIGIMVETPAAAILIDKYAKVPQLKFISFGTNDLTQYTLAVDRGNVKVSYIYDELDPSIIRLMALAASEARKRGVEVEVCGEMAGRQLAIPLLLSLGIDALSVSPPLVGLVKYTVSKLSRRDLERELLTKALNSTSASEVKEFTKEYLKRAGIEIF